MYSRIISYPKNKSFFLFGPRSTGKSCWVRAQFKAAAYVDLLEAEVCNRLLPNPQRLGEFIGDRELVVIDEVQKIPSLLDEVHRLIELKRLIFVLTGSSARKLKRSGINLLAGRALTKFMHPLSASELGNDFSLTRALRFGMLPPVYVEEDAKAFLQSYVRTYLKEEIELEGLTRNIGSFSRFLEQISFSQACPLNISQVSSDCAVARKTVEEYVKILEDLLLAYRVPVFARRAKRKLAAHPKFYLFDAGVFRAIRPAGPLDLPEEIEGAALETLLFQELLALNEYHALDYQISYWRTRTGLEVDFVLYGSRGLKAFEVKRSKKIRPSDLQALKAFKADYPESSVAFLYGGERELFMDGIQLLPLEHSLPRLAQLL